MAQGLEVPHPLRRGRDGLQVHDPAWTEGHLRAKPPLHQPGEHLQLHLAHEVEPDLPQRLVPLHLELGVLLLQNAQLGQEGMRVAPLRGDHLVSQYRFQLRARPVLFQPQALAGPGAGEARHGAHRPRRGLLRRDEPCPRVQPELGGFLLPVRALHRVPHFQRAPGDLHPGEPLPLFVPGNLEHTGGKPPGPVRFQGKPGQPVQQGLHPLYLQRRPKKAGEQLPPHNKGGQVAVVQPPRLQVALHQPLVAQGGLLQRLPPRPGKIGAALVQPPPQLGQQSVPVRTRLVHLVHKQEGGHLVALQQPPQGFRVALHPVRPADQQHRAVQHLYRPLHLGGKVHVARGVQQGEFAAPPVQPRLLGEDGNSPLPLLLVGVQEGVPVIHPPQPPHRAGQVQHGLGQRGLAGVHMGQQSCADPLDRLAP